MKVGDVFSVVLPQDAVFKDKQCWLRLLGVEAMFNLDIVEVFIGDNVELIDGDIKGGLKGVVRFNTLSRVRRRKQINFLAHTELSSVDVPELFLLIEKSPVDPTRYFLQSASYQNTIVKDSDVSRRLLEYPPAEFLTYDSLIRRFLAGKFPPEWGRLI